MKEFYMILKTRFVTSILIGRCDKIWNYWWPLLPTQIKLTTNFIYKQTVEICHVNNRILLKSKISGVEYVCYFDILRQYMNLSIVSNQLNGFNILACLWTVCFFDGHKLQNFYNFETRKLWGKKEARWKAIWWCNDFTFIETETHLEMSSSSTPRDWWGYCLSMPWISCHIRSANTNI